MYQSCLVKWQEFNRPLWVASALQGFPLFADRLAQPERVLRLGGAAEALRQAYGPALGFDPDLYWSEAEQTHYAQFIAAARAQLDEACARCVWAEGHAMSLAGAVRYALAADFSSQHS